MFKHSLIYRLLSSSCLLGWLVSDPEEKKSDYISVSYSYRLSNSLIEAVLNILYKCGDTIKKLGEGSLAVKDILGFIGMMIFFYVAFDLLLNDYSLSRTIIEVILALGGILMPLIKKVPGIWQGSLFLSFLRWWGRTD